MIRISQYQQNQINQQMQIVILNNKIDGDECDLSDIDIENQMNSLMQEIMNNDGELNYGYI